MKTEIRLQKSTRGNKYYLILDNIFIIKISKKNYQMLSAFYNWLEQYNAEKNEEQN